MYRYVIITALSLFLLGCEGLQVNIPVEVQSVRREDAALLVYIKNKSTLMIKVTFPVQSGILNPSQDLVFSLPRPGNYHVVVTAYEKGRDYRYDYREVSTVEVPVFLNGYDIFDVKGRLVGHHIEITDGMLLPNK